MTRAESVPLRDVDEYTNAEYARHYTDAGNGYRFAQLHRDRFRYDADRKIWRIWDGRCWAPSVEGDRLRAGKETADQMLIDAAHIADLDVREKAVKWALKSSNVDKVNAMVKMASSELTLETRTRDYDRSPDLLTVENGTIDLSSGKLRPHRQDDYITRHTPIAFDPSAPCPRWRQFLGEIFAGDEELIAFAQRAVGYTLTGHTQEHAFFILHGCGKNGKGRFVRQVMRLLGDYAHTTAFATFTYDRAKQTGNTPELAAMFGKRVVCAGEPDKGVRLSESLIKSLTGDDEIEACAKYEAPFRYTPVFKIWLHCNYRPEIRGTDPGIWRRPRLLPFNVSFEGRADMKLDAKLDAEGPGILAWAVEGARAWYAHGLGDAKSVAAATADYRHESDVIGAFIDDRLTFEKEGWLTRKRALELYTKWCEANGEEPWKPATLYQRLVERDGVTHSKQYGDRGFKGLSERAL